MAILSATITRSSSISSVNLTSLGGDDYLVGRGDNLLYNYKSGGTLIGTPTANWSFTDANQTPSGYSVSGTDGDPTSSFTITTLYGGFTDSGQTWEVTISGVGTATRNLILFWSNGFADASVTATLSDASVSPLTLWRDDGDGSGDYFTYELEFAAGSAGQTLTLEVLTEGPNCFIGWLWVSSEEGGATDYPIDAATGSYAVTGTSATLAAGRAIDSATGSYAVTGTSATLVADRAVNAATGSYSVTGFDATLTVDRIINAEAGSYATTGINAELEYTPVGAYEINAEAGSYSITGNDTALLTDRTINAEIGTYTLTGNSASLVADRAIDLNVGSYTVTGFEAELLDELPAGVYELNAESGSYTITGSNVTFIAPVRQTIVDTGAGAPPQRQKKRPVVVIRDEEPEQVTVKQIKQLVARRIGKAPIKQEVERQAIELAEIFPIDLTEATELIDNITQQEIIANIRRRQQQDDELAIKLLLGLE